MKFEKSKGLVSYLSDSQDNLAIGGLSLFGAICLILGLHNLVVSVDNYAIALLLVAAVNLTSAIVVVFITAHVPLTAKNKAVAYMSYLTYHLAYIVYIVMNVIAFGLVVTGALYVLEILLGGES